MYQIKNRWTDAVLFASETADSVRDALLAAIAANAMQAAFGVNK